MENKESDPIDQNLERLLQSAYGPQARPAPPIRLQTLKLLAADLKARQVSGEFPVKALAFLTLLLVAALGWFAAQVAGVEFGASDSPAQAMLALFVLANLFLTPVAGIVIVIRRKRYG